MTELRPRLVAVDGRPTSPDADIDVAREAGCRSVDLDSQVHAIGFYERLGFVAGGDVFMDAGIPHRNMVLRLSRGPS